MASQEVSDSDLIRRVAQEISIRRHRGEQPSLQEYLRLYPDMAPEIARLFGEVATTGPESQRGSSHAVSAAPSVDPGKQLHDYRIIREIGRGGMGIVYQAEQRSLARNVALKVLTKSSGVSALSHARERFRREAKAVARLHHSNIVPVYEVGETGDVCFYSMQLIEGRSLAEIIDELRYTRSNALPFAGALAGADRVTHPPIVSEVARCLEAGRFEPVATAASGTVGPPVGNAFPTGPVPNLGSTGDATEALTTQVPASGESSGLAGGSTGASCGRDYSHNVARIGQQAAEALAYAHARGVVHRDVKPGNLLLDRSGVVWVTDFGLAQTDEEGLTEAGDVVGTIRYLAPERFHGQCDARADVYALGLTIYELLLLRPAFLPHERGPLVQQILHAEPDRPRQVAPGVPRDLETVVLKAIEKDPARRYQSAAALAEDLRRFTTGEPILARPVSGWERVMKWAKRRPAAAALAIVSGVAALSLVVLLLIAWRSAEARAAAIERLGMAEELLAARETELAVLDDRVRQETVLVAAKRAEIARLRQDAEEAHVTTRRAKVDARRAVYLRDIHLAQLAWEGREVRRVTLLLDGQRPAAADEDVRGFEWHYLWKLTHRERRLWKGHKAFVHCVAYSPDGKLLVSADVSGTLVLRDAVSGTLQPPINPEIASVRSAAFTHDSRMLLTGHEDGHVRFWNLATGKCDMDIPGSGRAAWAVALDARSATLAIGDEGGVVRVHDRATGRLIHVLRGHRGRITSVDVAPDGSRIASRAEDWTVRLWSTEDGKELRAFRPVNGNCISSATFSPDSRTVAVGECWPFNPENTGAIRLYESRTGNVRRHWPILDGGAFTLAYARNGQVLAVASSHTEISLWEVKTAHCRDTFRSPGGRAYAVALSPDGTTVASGHEDNEVRLWNMSAEPMPITVPTRQTAMKSLAFAPDGRTLATPDASRADAPAPLHDKSVPEILGPGDRGLGVNLRDPASGRVTGIYPIACAVSGILAYSPDGRWLAATRPDFTIQLWDRTAQRPGPVLTGHSAMVTGLAFSSDSKTLASTAFDGSVRLWNAGAPMKAQVLKEGHDRIQIWSVAFAPDDRTLATCGEDGTVRLWELPAGKVRATLQGKGGGILCVAYSPNGSRLVASNWAGYATVWDAATGRELAQLRGHAQAVVPVAFAPDGNTVATGSTDGTVRLWDMATFRERFTFAGNGKIHAVAFSPDGRRLAATTGHFVRIWDAVPAE